MVKVLLGSGTRSVVRRRDLTTVVKDGREDGVLNREGWDGGVCWGRGRVTDRVSSYYVCDL